MAIRIGKGTIERASAKAKPFEIAGKFGLILRVQPTGRKTWYVQLGRGKRKRIGDAEVMTAARAEFLARAELNKAEDPDNPAHREARKATLGGFITDTYTPWVKANRRRAEKTLSDLERCFEHLSQRPLSEIKGEDLDAYVAARLDDGRTAATIVRDLNNLRSVFRRAIKDGYLRDTPFRGWERPKVDDAGRPRYLDAEEETRLRTALRERDERVRRERESANKWREERSYAPLPEIGPKDYADHLTPMVLISMNTGLRYGELTGLEWASIDFRAKVLTVTGRTAKGAKTRHIPLNAEALDVLKRWRGQRDGAGLVFANADGERIQSVKTAWLALLKAAKVKDFRWHDLRHSFASKLVQKEVNLAVVRDLLGHGDFKLTLRYAHLEEKQKKEAVARLAA